MCLPWSAVQAILVDKRILPPGCTKRLAAGMHSVLRHNRRPKLNITWDKDSGENRGKDGESAVV
jgi:hypothetical protein